MTRGNRTWLLAALVAIALYALVLAGCAPPNQSADRGLSSMEQGGSFGTTSSTTPEQTQTTIPDTSTTMPTETIPPSTEQTDTGSTTNPTWNMRQRVTVDGFQLIVMSRSFMTAVGGTKAPAGKRLLRLTVWVKNTSGSARRISASDFRLMDANDDPISAMRMRGKGYLSGTSKKTLRPGRQQQYKIVFVVPKDERRFTMSFMPATGMSGPVDIIVK